MKGRSDDFSEGGRKHLIRAVADELVAMLPAQRKRRLNLVLTDRHIERLERLEKLVDATTIAEVIREALFVYEMLVEKRIRGSVFKELTAKGDLFPLELGIDVHPRLLSVIEDSKDTGVRVQRKSRGVRTANNR